MNTKQKIILWVFVILIVIFLGLQSSWNGMWTDLTFYGFTWGATGTMGKWVSIGYYKYQLIIATLLIGLASFLSMGKKK